MYLFIFLLLVMFYILENLIMLSYQIKSVIVKSDKTPYHTLGQMLCTIKENPFKENLLLILVLPNVIIYIICHGIVVLFRLVFKRKGE